MVYELRFINKKSVGVEAAQISPKLSMSLPRLFPDTNALLLLPKNRLFVNENLKIMDLWCLQWIRGFHYPTTSYRQEYLKLR